MNDCSGFLHRVAPVVENVPMAERTFRLRLRCPELAAALRPGQFLMVRLNGRNDPLLGRPFAFYDTADDEHGVPTFVDVVYLVVGRVTGQMALLRPDDGVTVWGPLGHGFPDHDSAGRVNLVAGGIGQTPFLAYSRHLLGTRGYGGDPARRRVQEIALYYGVRTATLAAGVDDFRAAGVSVRLASDDGSLGERGYVTQLLERDAPPGPYVGCGPEPMLHALAKLAERQGRECHVSLETPMACGVGVCYSCVTKVKTPGGWDYRRVCVEGPVFDAQDLAWNT